MTRQLALLARRAPAIMPASDRGRCRPARPDGSTERGHLETMAQHCTILCPADEPGRVAALVKDLVGDRGIITIEGDDPDWSAITIEERWVVIAP